MKGDAAFEINDPVLLGEKTSHHLTGNLDEQHKNIVITTKLREV